MAHIGGQRTEDNDNDPVEVRHYQILGSGLDDALGRFPTSSILHRTLVGRGDIFWQYFPNGIIISTPDTCASVLYGPIFDYWDRTGEFDGDFGAPTSDLLRIPSPAAPLGSPPPPPNGTYATFQHGVLYLGPGIEDTVTPLSPLPPGLVQSATKTSPNDPGILPTGEGIAAAAQSIVQGFADNALATNQRLHDNVSSITTTVTFDSTGPGGCSGAGFNSVGRSLLHSHLFKVHFDFVLKGCAGTFGGAWADLRIEVRLFLDPPSVTARLVNYWIDGVGSPFGAGDQDIREGLSGALNGHFGHDLLNRSMPTGLTVLGAIVEDDGDVNLYIAPVCAAGSVLRSAGTSESMDSLGQLRRLRSEHLLQHEWGRDFAADQDFLGPVFVALLHEQRDAAELGHRLARLLTDAFAPGTDLSAGAAQLAEPAARLRELIVLQQDAAGPGWARQLGSVALDALRTLEDTVSFEEATRVAHSVLGEQLQQARSRGRVQRSSH